LANEAGISISDIASGVEGTGGRGRLTSFDVQSYLSSPQSKQQPITTPPSPTPIFVSPTTSPPPLAVDQGGVVLGEVEGLREHHSSLFTLAKQTVPHYHLSSDINFNAILASFLFKIFCHDYILNLNKIK